MPRARHAIALARFAANSPDWFEGRAFELTSKTPRLQQLVGAGGTLWVVVSRRVGGETVYSLKFKYVCCRKHTYRRNVGFGKFSVVGDRVKSSVFAWNDATLSVPIRQGSPRRLAASGSSEAVPGRRTAPR